MIWAFRHLLRTKHSRVPSGFPLKFRASYFRFKITQISKFSVLDSTFSVLSSKVGAHNRCNPTFLSVSSCFSNFFCESFYFTCCSIRTSNSLSASSMGRNSLTLSWPLNTAIFPLAFPITPKSASAISPGPLTTHPITPILRLG